MIHRMIRRRLGRRQGQGMTEYIVIVGLIAILLVAVVIRFKEQLRVTIEGSDGNGGMTGEVDDISDGIAAPTEDGNPTGPRGNGGTTSGGYRLSGDRTQVDDGSGNWVPYNPSTHGDLPTG